MTFTKGGTINLGGKTYNVSQINSVYIGNVKRYSGCFIWGAWFLWGIAGWLLFVKVTMLLNLGGELWTVWAIATIAAFITALKFTVMKDYAVFFDMSSGKVSAYSNESKAKVEEIRDDIIKGMEEGYFPNYLQGRN